MAFVFRKTLTLSSFLFAPVIADRDDGTLSPDIAKLYFVASRHAHAHAMKTALARMAIILKTRRANPVSVPVDLSRDFILSSPLSRKSVCFGYIRSFV